MSDEVNISKNVVNVLAAEVPLENTLANNFTLVHVDAMAEVQSMGKPDIIKNCSELVDHFIHHVVKK